MPSLLAAASGSKPVGGEVHGMDEAEVAAAGRAAAAAAAAAVAAAVDAEGLHQLLPQMTKARDGPSARCLCRLSARHPPLARRPTAFPR
jgi:hypothetical protein